MCTQEELKNALTTNPDSGILYSAAQRVWSGSKEIVTIELVLSKKLQKCMKKFGLKEFSGLFITNDDIRHIRSNHGIDEERRGQENIEPSDFALLPFVINDFDTCLESIPDKKGNRAFTLFKDIGSRYYVVTIQRGKKKLQVKTMWKLRPKKK